jgi:hypothetical protein
MKGLNSYHRVETWRSTACLGGLPWKAPATASQQMGQPLTGTSQRVELVSRSPSPAVSLPKKVPLGEEREFRGGIHNQVSCSSDSGDENQSHATFSCVTNAPGLE